MPNYCKSYDLQAKINLLIKSELLVKKPGWTESFVKDSDAGSEVLDEDASREAGCNRTGGESYSASGHLLQLSDAGKANTFISYVPLMYEVLQKHTIRSETNVASNEKLQ